ncbi:hypothetical protein ACWGJ2_00925 [Streptomyces sp. NPDC054796]
MPSLSLFASIIPRAVSWLRTSAREDRGYTSEVVIWTATLTGLAMSIVAIWGPEILDAARSALWK